MKRAFIISVLCMLLCLCLTAAAYAFGETTPGGDTSKDSGFGETTPDANNDPPPSEPAKQDNTPTTNTPVTNTPATSNPSTGPQGGGSITYQYDAGAYDNEKTVEEQLIEEAELFYGGPRLSSLDVGGLVMTPLFSAETFYYAVFVPDNYDTVTISASSSSGSVYIDGTETSTSHISMTTDARLVRVTVADKNGSVTYTVELMRQLAASISSYPVLTHVRIENADFVYEQDISTPGGEVYINLPRESNKKIHVTLSANINVLTYCNNIRVYNVVFNTNVGAWQWKRQYIELFSPETRLEIFLADKTNLSVINTYTLILRQPSAPPLTPQLNIQMQVGNDEALVNEVLHSLEAPPVIKNGHTMVPLRFIAEALGAQVNWDDTQKCVEVSWQEQKLNLYIGQATDGMPQAPFIDNGRTMVPLRYVSERLSCHVEWIDATQEIIITRQPPEEKDS